MVITFPRNGTSFARLFVAEVTSTESDYALYFPNEDQEWFWTERWQLGERQVDEHIRQGEFEEFNTMDEFLASLGFTDE